MNVIHNSDIVFIGSLKHLDYLSVVLEILWMESIAEKVGKESLQGSCSAARRYAPGCD